MTCCQSSYNYKISTTRATGKDPLVLESTSMGVSQTPNMGGAVQAKEAEAGAG